MVNHEEEYYRKTIFLDIDGVLITHHNRGGGFQVQSKSLIKGTLEKLEEWNRKEYMIILVTGRKESTRQTTESILSELGITYDYLIMGLPRGQRVVINDYKPNSDYPAAHAICLERNVGIKNINI